MQPGRSRPFFRPPTRRIGYHRHDNRYRHAASGRIGRIQLAQGRPQHRLGSEAGGRWRSEGWWSGKLLAFAMVVGSWVPAAAAPVRSAAMATVANIFTGYCPGRWRVGAAGAQLPGLLRGPDPALRGDLQGSAGCRDRVEQCLGGSGLHGVPVRPRPVGHRHLLGYAGVGSAYGAAGSLVVLLVWIYYSAQIFLFGAEFTQVYANQRGAHVEPAEGAVRLTASERAQQGMGGQQKRAGREKPEQGEEPAGARRSSPPVQAAIAAAIFTISAALGALEAGLNIIRGKRPAG